MRSEQRGHLRTDGPDHRDARRVATPLRPLRSKAWFAEKVRGFQSRNHRIDISCRDSNGPPSCPPASTLNWRILMVIFIGAAN